MTIDKFKKITEEMIKELIIDTKAGAGVFIMIIDYDDNDAIYSYNGNTCIVCVKDLLENRIEKEETQHISLKREIH